MNFNYAAFADMSGGRIDAAALAISHSENKKAVVDLARRWPAPHDPASVVREMAELLKYYGLHRVTGDRYAGSCPEQEFQRHNVRYEPSTRDKSAIYIDFLPLVMSGNVELLDNERIFNELRSLERRTHSGGRDSVDHPPRGHDDLANAVAGSCVLVDLTRKQVWIGTRDYRDSPGQKQSPASVRIARRKLGRMVEGSISMRTGSDVPPPPPLPGVWYLFLSLYPPFNQLADEPEIEALLGECPSHLKPSVQTAILTGMRRGEILSLKWELVRHGCTGPYNLRPG